MRDRDFEGRLAVPAEPNTFSAAEIHDVPDPAKRYFEAAISPGTPLARSARFRKRGQIKLGGRRLRFTARQVESPHVGFLWAATWSASDETHVTASYRIDDTRVDLRMTVDGDGKLRAVVFDRWGDPESTGRWGIHTFGFEVGCNATFDSVSIPAAGRAGWFVGTDRWTDGEFFRSEITDCRLVRSS
jgi:hypothetical protein